VKSPAFSQRFRHFGVFWFIFLASFTPAAPFRQVVVAIAPTWDSPSGRMQLFERQGGRWTAAGEPVPVLFGRAGLAWGRGLHGEGGEGPGKVERDKRAPAGLFQIGRIYTYDEALPEGAHYPFHTIGEGDAWIDDPEHPQYNRHVVVDRSNPPAWFERQRMRLNDPPHRWLIEIRHNADPPVPGAGSAIFFHIRRGEETPSAGCTVMSAPAIIRMIRWLRAESNPRYVLLPRAEYLRFWKEWDLPSPSEASALLGD